MLKSERHSAIVRLCSTRGAATVKQIADELDVSQMTVRRDLDELAAEGRLERVHGGAQVPESSRGTMLSPEYTHSEKRGQHAEEKQRAAAAAAALISPGDTVFLGTGTTIEPMAGMLPEGGLRIITNSLPAFTALRERRDCELYLVGGVYRPVTDALVGITAERTVEMFGIDKAFVGATGVFDGDVFGSHTEAGRLLQVALDRSGARYVVADPSKVGRRDFYAFYRLEDVDAFVTDAGIDEQTRGVVEAYTRVLC